MSKPSKASQSPGPGYSYTLDSGLEIGPYANNAALRTAVYDYYYAGIITHEELDTAILDITETDVLF